MPARQKSDAREAVFARIIIARLKGAGRLAAECLANGVEDVDEIALGADIAHQGDV